MSGRPSARDTAFDSMMLEKVTKKNQIFFVFCCSFSFIFSIIITRQNEQRNSSECQKYVYFLREIFFSYNVLFCFRENSSKRCECICRKIQLVRQLV